MGPSPQHGLKLKVMSALDFLGLDKGNAAPLNLFSDGSYPNQIPVFLLLQVWLKTCICRSTAEVNWISMNKRAAVIKSNNCCIWAD